MNENRQFEFLDVLSIISFALQMQNQRNIVGIRDVQSEVDRAIDEIHSHLEMQDEKLNFIIGVISDEAYQKTEQTD